VERAVGDFIVARADGLIAYQLAVVVDDAAQGITDVVRGADLLDSTPRQLWLQRLLNLPTLRYLHVPVAVNSHGEKLSKQTRARALDPQNPVPALFDTLRFLGQAPPPQLRLARLTEVWDWALGNWQQQRIPALRAEPFST
jgi:glutamyl-Q tRNA(Asp) synthetase